ncbi:MAG: YidC/Oxa1 family membrane protein insertase, partial [Candidatus Liptonbacteria bacterium]|nr:YidC/Oxa1 family membrane protein insertase [Candidatus Liptonbacteria bacterium]
LGSLEPDFLLNGLYPFVSAPETLNAQFLGLINLGGRSMLIVGLAAAAQYVQGRLGTKRARTKAPMSAVERMSEQMVYLAPVFTFAILVGLPAAVGLYWVATSAFSIVQQLIINRQLEHGKFGNLHQENG